MVIIKRQFVRPNENVPWYQTVITPTQDFLSRWGDYQSTGKVINWDMNISEDQLTMNYSAYWRSLEEYHEYDTDPLLDPYWDLRDEYCNLLNITIGPKILDVIKEDGSIVTITVPAGKWQISDLPL